MSNMLLVVPLDKQAVMNYEFDVSKRERLKLFDFPEEEFDFLYKTGIIDELNNTFDIWIDEFEEEFIKNEFLQKTKEIIFKYTDKLPVFSEALNLAIEKGTLLGLEF